MHLKLWFWDYVLRWSPKPGFSNMNTTTFGKFCNFWSGQELMWNFPKQLFMHLFWSWVQVLGNVDNIGSIAFALVPSLHNNDNKHTHRHFFEQIFWDLEPQNEIFSSTLIFHVFLYIMYRWESTRSTDTEVSSLSASKYLYFRLRKAEFRNQKWLNYKIITLQGQTLFEKPSWEEAFLQSCCFL